eukprot:COSAG06_NODE_4286_length_4399_cov_3.887907_3_plen_93_part_00
MNDGRVQAGGLGIEGTAVESSLRAVRVARPLCSLCGRAIEAARILLLMDDEARLIQDNLSRAYAGCFGCDRCSHREGDKNQWKQLVSWARHD